MAKKKAKAKKPAWQWWTEKDLEQSARRNVMERPRHSGIGKRRIKSEIKAEMKRLAKKWKSESPHLRSNRNKVGDYPLFLANRVQIVRVGNECANDDDNF